MNSLLCFPLPFPFGKYKKADASVFSLIILSDGFVAIDQESIKRSRFF